MVEGVASGGGDPRSVGDRWSSGAELAEDVEVGPYSIIGPQVRIGAGTVVASWAVLATGAFLVTRTFLAGWTHPAKAVVDAVAAGAGFEVPAWYARLKADVEPEVDDPDRLRALAAFAGYPRIEVTTTMVDVGVRTPSELTRWRLGMAHLAPFVATLPTEARTRLRRSCEAALAGAPPLLVPLVVVAASTAG